LEALTMKDKDLVSLTLGITLALIATLIVILPASDWERWSAWGYVVLVMSMVAFNASDRGVVRFIGAANFLVIGVFVVSFVDGGYWLISRSPVDLAALLLYAVPFALGLIQIAFALAAGPKNVYCTGCGQYLGQSDGFRSPCHRCGSNRWTKSDPGAGIRVKQR